MKTELDMEVKMREMRVELDDVSGTGCYMVELVDD